MSDKYPLLNVSIADLLASGKLKEAIFQKDQQLNDIAELNKSFVPTQRTGGIVVMADRMDPMLNPVDGKMYDSRSAYHKAVDKKGAYIQEESRYTKLEKPSTFNEKKFDQSFKKALEQHGI